MKTPKFSEPFCVTNGKQFRLKDFDPHNPPNLPDKAAAAPLMQELLAMLSELQGVLYAADRWALLLIFQAMDAAGKDSTIKHVMSGVNPIGCQVFSFKEPSKEELDHDFLWRTSQRLPERGRIGIFNRSYYEEVLVVRVHPEYLQAERMPSVPDDIWAQRFEDINAHERYLVRNGIMVRKFFLNVSREEQERRFIERLERPEKNWKFSSADVKEREHWDEYMHAYQEMIQNTATAQAPWYVVPADRKWFTRLVVSEVVVQALESMNLQYPTVEPAKKKELEALRKQLTAARKEKSR